MQRAAHHAVRGAVVAALSALLLVLSGSMAGAAQVPSGTVAAHRAASAHHRSASTEPGPAAVAPVSRAQQPHRLDGTGPGLAGDLVAAPRPSYATTRDAAPTDRPHATTRVTRDGRAPPA